MTEAANLDLFVDKPVTRLEVTGDELVFATADGPEHRIRIADIKGFDVDGIRETAWSRVVPGALTAVPVVLYAAPTLYWLCGPFAAVAVLGFALWADERPIHSFKITADGRKITFVVPQDKGVDALRAVNGVRRVRPELPALRGGLVHYLLDELAIWMTWQRAVDAVSATHIEKFDDDVVRMRRRIATSTVMFGLVIPAILASIPNAIRGLHPGDTWTAVGLMISLGVFAILSLIGLVLQSRLLPRILAR